MPPPADPVEPLPPPEPRGLVTETVGGLYDRLVGLLPRSLRSGGGPPDVVVDMAPDAPSFDWQPDLGPDRREELRIALEGGVRPYIRRTADGRLLVSVAEPARRVVALRSGDDHVPQFGHVVRTLDHARLHRAASPAGERFVGRRR